MVLRSVSGKRRPYSVKNKTLQKEKILELGNVILDSSKSRYSHEQITVINLTGVAIQDIKITVFEPMLTPDLSTFRSS